MQTQKGGKGGCLSSQTSCEFPKHSIHQPQVSPTGDAWAEISMLEGIFSSLRLNPLVNFYKTRCNSTLYLCCPSVSPSAT